MKKLLQSFILLASVLFIVSCSSDNNGGDNGIEDRAAKQWIVDKVKEWYLWPSDVASRNPDLNGDYRTIFYSLLSTNRADGYLSASGSHVFYSYIDRFDAQTRSIAELGKTQETSFGFHFGVTNPVIRKSAADGYLSGEYNPIQGTNYFQKVYLTVLYVVPGSPAERAGLRRGDNIGTINGTEITQNNYRDLYPQLLADDQTGQYSPATIKFYRPTDTGDWEQFQLQGGGTANFRISTQRLITPTSVSIAPATFQSSPILQSRVMNVGGRNVGYIMYNSFNTGGDNHTYDDQLKSVFNSFNTAGISELVLDLRYNGGGYVSSCLLMGSMIAPASKGGTVFQRSQFNSSKGSHAYNLLTTSEMRGANYGTTQNGVNLGLSRVYIITTGSSASASETLIHCLRGSGIEVVVIGQATLGKNVGMSGIMSQDYSGIDFGNYRYEMWPVTFYIQDANGQSYTTAGISPNAGASYRELNEVQLLEFGNEREIYLSYALQHIGSGTFPAEPSPRSPGSSLQGAVVNSIEQYVGPVPGAINGLYDNLHTIE